MALWRVCQKVLLRRIVQTNSPNPSNIRIIHHLYKLGAREIVGHGKNGPTYIDAIAYPFPGIRWKEVTPEIQEIRKKEKENWKNLTLDDKKTLYRASFCQTFAEILAPTGEWKLILGCALIAVGIALFLNCAVRIYVYDDLPASFSDENQKAQLQRMIVIMHHPVTGIASKWDYDKWEWKN